MNESRDSGSGTSAASDRVWLGVAAKLRVGAAPFADLPANGYVTVMESETLAVFEGPAGSLRVGVERYQFPEITNDEWNSNWLIIRGDVDLAGKSWGFRDPCLTTFEMERLADWLDHIAVGEVEKAFCGFTEPNLDFEQLSNDAIRVGFSLEALPPWIDHDADFGEIGLILPINERLVAAASSLRRLLERFPVRARSDITTDLRPFRG